MPRFSFNKQFLIVLALLILSIIAIRFTTPLRNTITPLESLVRGVLAPLQGGATAVQKAGGNFFASIFNFRNLEKENQQLKAELEKATMKNNFLEEERQQNLRLRQLLDIKDKMSNEFDLTAAEVIARDSKNWDKLLLVNKGSSDGLKKGMAVITQQGLVGRVNTVTSKTAEIILLQNRDGAVAGLIQVSRFPGVVEGTKDSSGLLQMIHLPYDAPIEKNQIIVTSGLGEIIPKGLRIGYIVDVKIEPNGLMKKAIIKPFVDFNRVEEVFIVTGVKGGE